MSTVAAFAVTFNARQGSVFTKTVTVPFSLVGHELRMQVRRTPGEAGAALIDIATTTSGIDWVNRAGGIFAINIPATTLTDVEPSPSVGWVYDLEVVPPGGEDDAYALFGGAFIIAAEVTV